MPEQKKALTPAQIAAREKFANLHKKTDNAAQPVAATLPPPLPPAEKPTYRPPIKYKEVMVAEEDKVYTFQLVNEYRQGKPVDKRTGKVLGDPWPPKYGILNEGIAYDDAYVNPDTGKTEPRARKWRYIEGQPSIWADEQPGLDNMDAVEIGKLLGEEHNTIVFHHGKLHVRGIEKLKLQAIMCQDEFEGKKKQYRPKARTYRLLNPSAIIEGNMLQLDKQFGAQQLARTLTDQQVLECAYVMGIDINDTSKAGFDAIKYQFYKKAEYDPKNPKGVDWFTGIVNNNTTHPTYVFAQALERGILSGSQQPGRLTWGYANQVISGIDINPNLSIADQLVSLYCNGNTLCEELLGEVEKQLDLEYA